MTTATSKGDTAARLNLQSRRGDAFNMSVTLKQNGAAEDITGHKFSMTVIRKGDARKRPVLEFVEYEFVNMGGGKITTQKAAEDMQLPATVYYYELKQTYPDGTGRVRLCGDFILNSNVLP